MFKVKKTDDGYCCSFNTFDVSEVSYSSSAGQNTDHICIQGFSKPAAVEDADDEEESEYGDEYHYHLDYDYEEIEAALASGEVDQATVDAALEAAGGGGDDGGDCGARDEGETEPRGSGWD